MLNTEIFVQKSYTQEICCEKKKIKKSHAIYLLAWVSESGSKPNGEDESHSVRRFSPLVTWKLVIRIVFPFRT